MPDLRRQLAHCELKIVRLKREARRVYGAGWRHKSIHFRIKILAQIDKARRIRDEMRKAGVDA